MHVFERPSFRSSLSLPCTLNPLFFILCNLLSLLASNRLIIRRKHRKTRNTLRRIAILSETATAIFASRLKSEVITGSGGRGCEKEKARVRERERNREELKDKWREDGKGWQGRGDASLWAALHWLHRIRIRATLLQAADDALRNISKAYRTSVCSLWVFDVGSPDSRFIFSAGFNMTVESASSKLHVSLCFRRTSN